MGALLSLLLVTQSITWREIPAGTPLHIRLTTAVGSYASHPGSTVSAVLIAPVAVGGGAVLPAGSTLSGEVTSVHRIGLGVVRERASLGLDFNSVSLPGALPGGAEKLGHEREPRVGLQRFARRDFVVKTRCFQVMLAQESTNLPSHAGLGFSRQSPSVHQNGALVGHDIRLSAPVDGAHADRGAAQERVTPARQLFWVAGLEQINHLRHHVHRVDSQFGHGAMS